MHIMDEQATKKFLNSTVLHIAIEKDLDRLSLKKKLNDTSMKIAYTSQTG